MDFYWDLLLVDRSEKVLNKQELEHFRQLRPFWILDGKLDQTPACNSRWGTRRAPNPRLKPTPKAPSLTEILAPAFRNIIEGVEVSP